MKRKRKEKAMSDRKMYLTLEVVFEVHGVGPIDDNNFPENATDRIREALKQNVGAVDATGLAGGHATISLNNVSMQKWKGKGDGEK